MQTAYDKYDIFFHFFNTHLRSKKNKCYKIIAITVRKFPLLVKFKHPYVSLRALHRVLMEGRMRLLTYFHIFILSSAIWNTLSWASRISSLPVPKDIFKEFTCLLSFFNTKHMDKCSSFSCLLSLIRINV